MWHWTPVSVYMDKGDKAIDNEFIVFALNDLHVRDKSGLTGKNHLGFKAKDGALWNRIFKKHPMNIDTNDVFRRGQIGGGNKAGFDKPLSPLTGKEGAVMIQI